MALTRGERCDNPLNIDRTTIQWVGMAPVQSDPRFITWVSPEYCYRCASRIIRLHYASGRNTVEAIVNAWAPATENPTSNYVTFVAQHMGVDPSVPLTITDVTGDPSQLLPLLKGMTAFENGEDIYADSVIQAGMDLNASGVGEP